MSREDKLFGDFIKVVQPMPELIYLCDNQRHLICLPYSKENLHRMAEELGIKRCWFHRDHYDIPKRRIQEIMDKCRVVSPKFIAKMRMAGLLEP